MIPARGETFQHYEVLRRDDGSLWELGRGAMGVTYKAIDNNLHSLVALKVIYGLFLNEQKARDRFVREARAAASLRHRNVATIYHLGQDAQSFFYAMEFVDGETLASHIERDGPLPWRAALSAGLQVTRALMAAHAKNLVHRDIKPANIMLVHEPDEEAPVVKLIDFGLAKTLAEEGGSIVKLSGSGFLGTPLYASPEQCEEIAPDIRSDIYSLGVTLWHSLAGQPPFNGTLASVFNAHLYADLPWEQLPDEVPHPVRLLLWRMLAKDAAERFQTPLELRAEIDACLSVAVAPAPADDLLEAIVDLPPATPAPRLPTRRLTPASIPPPDQPVETREKTGARQKGLIALAMISPVAIAAVVVWLVSSSTRHPAATVRVIPSPAGTAVSVAVKPLPVPTIRPAATPAMPSPASAPVWPPSPPTLSPPPTRDPVERFASALNEARVDMAGMRWEAAVQAYTQVLALRPDWLEAWTERGMARGNLGQFTDSRADCAHAVLLPPANARENYYLAFAYELLGRAPEARAAFQTAAFGPAPSDAREYLMRGRAYASLKRFDQAIMDYGSALRLDPHHARVFLNCGDAECELKNYPRAIEDYNEALRLCPENVLALNKRGAANAAMQRRDEARRDFDEALRLDPRNTDTLNERGNLSVRARDYLRAAQDFDEALRLDPSRSETHVNRACVFSVQKNPDRALQEFDEAVRLNPNNVVALTCRGSFLTNQNRYERALVDLDKAIQLDPSVAEAHLNRANVFLALKRYDRALLDYKEATRLAPTNVDAHNNLAITHANMRQFDQAITEYDTALRLNPLSADTFNNRGVAYYIQKKYEPAIRDLTDAIRLNPRSPIAYRNRALAERKLGRNAEANADDAHATELARN